MTVRALNSAEEDLIIAARKLELARPGFGGQLLAEYSAALENNGRFPRMYSLVEDELSGREVRNALLERLKYRVVYELRIDETLVVAVLHTSREDNLWHDRLKHD